MKYSTLTALSQHAMKTVGISSDVQEQIFRMLAGILHLGNIEFQPAAKDSSTIKNKQGKHFFHPSNLTIVQWLPYVPIYWVCKKVS
jgi:myosin heavy subunit